MNTVGQNPSHVNAAETRGVLIAPLAVSGSLSHHSKCRRTSAVSVRYGDAFAGEIVTDARRPSSLAAVLALVLALVPACAPTIDDGGDSSSSGSSSSGSSSSDDGGAWCICDAFGPPGVFDPTTCDDGTECCDHDDDGIADAAPIRLVCFGGAR